MCYSKATDRLKQEGRAMKRFRMSNGYWYNAKCDMCGKDFYGKRSTATYCSDACKQAAYRIEKRRKEEAKKLQIPLFDQER